MKKLFFVLIFTIFFATDSSALTCSDLDVNPVISVYYSFGRLSYDVSKTPEEITELAKQFKIIETNTFAEGLATADINFDISVEAKPKFISIENFCVIPTKVDMFIGLRNPTIYISNSLQKNSCKYNIVVRHEQTHQQINKTTLEYYLPIFKAAAINIIKSVPPVQTNNTSQSQTATEKLTETYNQKLMPLVEFIKNETAKEQFKLDNEANYKYEHLLCK